eukprot:jgi/Galph1/136/GphlegSOOS_G4813.1
MSYGLSLKLSNKRTCQRTQVASVSSVFEGEEEVLEQPADEIKKSWESQARYKVLDQTSAAVCTDPDAYMYDEVYDQIHQKTSAVKSLQAQPKSRYLEALKARAAERKLEQELLQERLSLKEREEEEKRGEFKDKEKFVTSAYKEKMEQLKAWEKTQAELDAATSNKKDMTTFYSSLFTKNVAMGSLQDDQQCFQSSEVKQESISRVATQPANLVVSDSIFDHQRKEAFYGEPEQKPGGLFVPHPRNKELHIANSNTNSQKDTDTTSDKASLSKPSNTLKKRKDEAAVAQARERYIARKQKRCADE